MTYTEEEMGECCSTNKKWEHVMVCIGWWGNGGGLGSWIICVKGYSDKGDESNTNTTSDEIVQKKTKKQQTQWMQMAVVVNRN